MYMPSQVHRIPRIRNHHQTTLRSRTPARTPSCKGAELVASLVIAASSPQGVPDRSGLAVWPGPLVLMVASDRAGQHHLREVNPETTTGRRPTPPGRHRAGGTM